MPQSSAALRQKAQALRLLKNLDASLSAKERAGLAPRLVWARVPFSSKHGSCVALDLRNDGLWVRVKDAHGVEASAPVARILNPEQRREWARRGFG